VRCGLASASRIAWVVVLVEAFHCTLACPAVLRGVDSKRASLYSCDRFACGVYDSLLPVCPICDSSFLCLRYTDSKLTTMLQVQGAWIPLLETFCFAPRPLSLACFSAHVSCPRSLSSSIPRLPSVHLPSPGQDSLGNGHRSLLLVTVPSSAGPGSVTETSRYVL
jgi:hypothetical protein